MSIFNGDSIYKSGGGGGGYKDGGALVDGDFIKVENNAVSNYKNETRNEINYYFEVKDGEVLNAVIELTNDVNATVNVYIVQNGLFIPIGNIGGDTVNAGEQYNINILGDSFSIEQVNNNSTSPEAVYLDNVIYRCKEYNGVLWLTENYKNIPAGLIVNPGNPNISNPACCYQNQNIIYYNWYAVKYIKDNVNLNGWDIPKWSDYTNLLNLVCPNGDSDVNNIKSSSGWTGTQGNNSSGFNAYPNGYREVVPPSYSGIGTQSSFWSSTEANDSSSIYLRIRDDSFTTSSISKAEYFNLRLIYRL